MIVRQRVSVAFRSWNHVGLDSQNSVGVKTAVQTMDGGAAQRSYPRSSIDFGLWSLNVVI